ncbi:MAG: hypothetical protein ACPLW9_01955 [Minisyncoccales bacterium]
MKKIVTLKSKQKLKNMKIVSIFPEIYPICKKISEKLPPLVTANEFVAICEEAIRECKTPRFYNNERFFWYFIEKIPEITEILFTEEEPEFVDEVKNVWLILKKELKKELAKPKFRTTTAVI